MSKLRSIIYILGFLSIIFIISILFWVTPQKKVSNIENRVLCQKPKINMEKLLSGEYFKAFDNYVNDQIPVRDTFIKYYTEINMKVLLKKKINDVVMGKNRYLLAYTSYPFDNYKFNSSESKKEENNISRMVDNIAVLKNYINSYGGDFYFVGIPNQVSYYKNSYPKYFYNSSEKLTFRNKLMFSKLNQKNIKNINMNEVFLKSNENNIYFKTDHHYNFNGALMVYQAIINKALEEEHIRTLSTLKYNDFKVITLNNTFIGSRNNQLYELFKNNDKLQIAYPKKTINYKKYESGSSDNKLYYIPSDPKEPVTYSVYMGGDKPETIIKTNRNYLDNILIFGDSYTNAVEPLLYLNFNETRILDLRYYNKKSLYEYIEGYKPKLVVMIRDDGSYTLESGNGKFN
ncbi:DHHW family protein [Clostridium kluyveri]|uniref:AlgX/AlgJ SGNH hydrolase-like domain-containing protein n=2 Tax=Clostridium kluyveri TaxID=1534 RepID=A5N568_CLOK5|nr:DHHW family protein [Clostridium kluyveri]EDK32449.1 Conserved hypothetical protein [Clostridium kluyveri DSM 555]BAH05396.1 hypothetical protein CKR_0345 [Clostridium kluyveri NBRC 12016]